MSLDLFRGYSRRLASAASDFDYAPVLKLCEALYDAWRDGKRVYLCGNGGSAGNAIHLANDFNYGISRQDALGLRVYALPANAAVVTCLGNDIGYDGIFSQQLEVQLEKDDVLIVLSGSGNSPNVLKALAVAKTKGARSFAILGFDGGKARQMADVPIHFPIHDMQIAEDLQLMVGHMAMQWLEQQGKERPVHGAREAYNARATKL